MTIDRRQFIRPSAGAVAMGMVNIHAAGIDSRPAASKAMRKLPIIDVHMHPYPADEALPASLVNPVTGKSTSLKGGEAHLQACLSEMKRLNVVKGIVSGGTGDRLAAASHWRETAPNRIIAGAGVRGSEDTPLPEIGPLRKAFESGRAAYDA
jgi:uncharacterized protein